MGEDVAKFGGKFGGLLSSGLREFFVDGGEFGGALAVSGAQFGVAFDKVVSVFGAMFFGDPVAAPGVSSSGTSGSPHCARHWPSVGRFLNRRGVHGAPLLSPIPTASDPSSKAGFAEVHFEPRDEPIELGRDAEDAFTFVSSMGIVKGLTEDLDEAARAEALGQLRTTLASHETDHGVLFGTSVWLITARRP